MGSSARAFILFGKYLLNPKVPQFVENYHNDHADGISLTFLVTWFVGDILNLAGSLWAHLLGTGRRCRICSISDKALVIALAIYFCFADVILISQCLYYQRLRSVTTADTTTEPLIPKSHDDDNSKQIAIKTVWKNTAAVVGVCIVGIAAWIFAWRIGLWQPSSRIDENDSSIGAVVLGYGSALCYLGHVTVPMICIGTNI